MSLIEIDNIKSGPYSNGQTFGRPSKYRPEMCDLVQELGAQGKSVVQMAAACGVSRKVFYEWLDDPDKEDFRYSFDLAITNAQAWWENEGQSSLHSKVFKENTWQFTLKSRFREDYWKDDTSAAGTGNTTNITIIGLETLDNLIERRQTLLAQANPQVPSKP